MKQDLAVVPVIMSGGAGTRLWPLSTKARPKQFHALTGRLTLLQQTVLRCPQSLGFAAPIVVCARRHADLVHSQCVAVNTVPALVVTEPVARNTAPCAVTAALAVRERQGPDALVLLLAADHHVRAPQAFVQAVQAAMPAARKGHIVTFGARPDQPATGYGYIRRGAALDAAAFGVDAFVEKPDAATAERYVQSGEYVWNAGIFLFRADVMLAQMQRHRPDIASAASAAWDKSRHLKTQNKMQVDLDPQAFAACPAQSLDYAVMEPTDKAAMVPLDAGWSDVGAWPALHALADKDAAGNACQGRIVTQDVHDCLLLTQGPLVAALGVENLAIIASKTAVLVAPMAQAEAIKSLMDALDDDER